MSKFNPIQDLKELENIEKAFYSTMPDYTKIGNGADLLEALGDESMKWAAAICQLYEKRFDTKLNLMYIQGFLANAIEHSYVVRKERDKKVAEQPVSDEPWVEIKMEKTTTQVELTPEQQYACSEFNHGEY